MKNDLMVSTNKMKKNAYMKHDRAFNSFFPNSCLNKTGLPDKSIHKLWKSINFES